MGHAEFLFFQIPFIFIGFVGGFGAGILARKAVQNFIAKKSGNHDTD